MPAALLHAVGPAGKSGSKLRRASEISLTTPGLDLATRLRVFQRALRSRVERRDALIDIVRAVNTTLEPPKIADEIVEPFIFSATDAILSHTGRIVTIAAWVSLTVVSLFFLKDVTIGDPTAASPLLWPDSPYNLSHTTIQEKFGGVEPLIIVAEGKDRDAMKDPHTLHTMEKFQRYLERDRDVGYSFSLTDILRTVNMVFHELEPKWGVVPNTVRDVGQTFFIFFANSPPTETSKYVTPDYQTAHVTFFCRNHKGDNIARIIEYAKRFIADPKNKMETAEFKLAGGRTAAVHRKSRGRQEPVRLDAEFLGERISGHRS